jgi:hypothetical protein
MNRASVARSPALNFSMPAALLRSGSASKMSAALATAGARQANATINTTRLHGASVSGNPRLAHGGSSATLVPPQDS